MNRHIAVPNGEKISFNQEGTLNVPDTPIIPYIEGDGIGVDITPVMKRVVDAAVEKAYGGRRRISWMEIYAGEKALKVYGDDAWLPQETLDAVREFHPPVSHHIRPDKHAGGKPVVPLPSLGQVDRQQTPVAQRRRKRQSRACGLRIGIVTTDPVVAVRCHRNHVAGSRRRTRRQRRAEYNTSQGECRAKDSEEIVHRHASHYAVYYCYSQIAS